MLHGSFVARFTHPGFDMSPPRKNSKYPALLVTAAGVVPKRVQIRPVVLLEQIFQSLRPTHGVADVPALVYPLRYHRVRHDCHHCAWITATRVLDRCWIRFMGLKTSPCKGCRSSRTYLRLLRPLSRGLGRKKLPNNLPLTAYYLQ